MQAWQSVLYGLYGTKPEGCCPKGEGLTICDCYRKNCALFHLMHTSAEFTVSPYVYMAGFNYCTHIHDVTMMYCFSEQWRPMGLGVYTVHQPYASPPKKLATFDFCPSLTIFIKEGLPP